MSTTMYADTVNGRYDMTYDDLMATVKANLFFSDPDDVAVVDSDGVEYTGRDLLSMCQLQP